MMDVTGESGWKGRPRVLLFGDVGRWRAEKASGLGKAWRNIVGPGSGGLGQRAPRLGLHAAASVERRKEAFEGNGMAVYYLILRDSHCVHWAGEQWRACGGDEARVQPDMQPA